MSDDASAAQPQPESGPIQFTLEDPSSFERVAHVTVSDTLLEEEREAAARKLASKAKLPGFRAGKVPAHLIRKQFAGQVEQDALESLIPRAYRELLESQEDLHPIAEPRVENLQMPEGEPIRFDLRIEVRPDVAISTDGLAVERVHVPITDARVDQALEELRERNAAWEPVERGAQLDDALMIDYVPLKEDGSPDEEQRNDSYTLLLGSDSVRPEFNSTLQGLEVGDDTEVDVAYPEDYPKEDLRGQTMRFRVKVKEIKEKRVPDLDDAFAQTHTSFSTLAELREDVEKELNRASERESRKQLRERLVDRLIEGNEVPVPPSLEARYVQSMVADYERMTNRQLDPEQRQKFAEQYAGMARRAAQRTILLDNLRRQQEIEASDEDVAAKIEELAAERDMQPEDFRRAVEGANQMDRLRSDLEEDLIFDWLAERAEITVVEHTEDPEEGDSGDDAASTPSKE